MGFGVRMGPFRVSTSRGRVYGGVSAGPFFASTRLAGGGGRRGKAAKPAGAVGGIALLALCGVCGLCGLGGALGDSDDKPDRPSVVSSPTSTPRQPAVVVSRSFTEYTEGPKPSPSTKKPAPKPATTSKKPPVPTTDKRYATCKEANAAGLGPYVEGEDPEYEWYRDRDKDGIVCEPG